MQQTAIFGPFFATMFLTLLVWVYMYIRRIGFITSSKLSPKDLAVPGALAQLSPPEVSNPSDNLKTCSRSRSSAMRSRCISSPHIRSIPRTWRQRGSSLRFVRFTAQSIARSMS